MAREISGIGHLGNGRNSLIEGIIYEANIQVREKNYWFARILILRELV
jgi:hypothetical protein